MSKVSKFFTLFFAIVLVCIVQGKAYGYNETSLSDTSSKAVKSLTIIYSANVVCQGVSVTLSEDHSSLGTVLNPRFEWNIDGSVNSSQEDSITITPTSQETKVILSLYDDMGFIASDTAYIYLASIPKTKVKHDTICYGDEATISVTGGNYWYWSIHQISSDINIRPGSTTSYLVHSSEYPINRAGYINDCYATDTVWVIVYHGGVIEINGDSVVCSGSEYTYSVKNAAFIEWWDGNTQNTRNIFISNDTTISYTGVNASGCKIEGSLHVRVEEVLFGEIISEKDSFCIGDTVYLSLETSTPNVRWFNGDTNSETKFVANVPFTVYCVISAMGSELNCTVRLEKSINVKECLSMFFPSGFKPDGVTHVYTPVGIINPSKKYEFSIYNSVGERMFETTDLTIGWDGKMRGKDLPAGVYFYLYRETIERFTFERRGTITLIR